MKLSVRKSFMAVAVIMVAVFLPISPAFANTDHISDSGGSVDAIDQGTQVWNMGAIYFSGSLCLGNTNSSGALWSGTSADCVNDGVANTGWGYGSSLYFYYCRGTYWAGVWSLSSCTDWRYVVD